MDCSAGCTCRPCGGSIPSSPTAPKARAWPTASSSPCSWPRKSPIGRRRGFNAACIAPTFRSSRRSTSTTSPSSRASASRCSAAPSAPTSSPRASRSSSAGPAARGRRTWRSPSPTARSRTASTLSSPPRRRSSKISRRRRAGKLRPVLPTYTHPAVLVIDEVGYLGYGPDAANVLFQVVNDRYLHQRPMIFTTNKPLAAWGRVLHDADLQQDSNHQRRREHIRSQHQRNSGS